MDGSWLIYYRWQLLTGQAKVSFTLEPCLPTPPQRSLLRVWKSSGSGSRLIVNPLDTVGVLSPLLRARPLCETGADEGVLAWSCPGASVRGKSGPRCGVCGLPRERADRGSSGWSCGSSMESA